MEVSKIKTPDGKLEEVYPLYTPDWEMCLAKDLA